MATENVGSILQGGIAPNEVTIRPRTFADNDQIVEIYNSVERDFPPLTAAEYRRFGEASTASGYFDQFVAEQHETLCGYCVLSASMSRQRRGDYLGSIRVRAAHQKQGVGRQLYDLLLDHAHTRAAERLRGWIREDLPGAREFVERRGFSPTGRSHRFLRLDTATLSLDRLAKLERGLRGQGIAIKTLAEFADENENGLHHLYAALEVAALIPYHVWLQELAGFGRSLLSTWVALDDGEPTALNWLRRQGKRAAFHEQMGVMDGERRRDTALALAARAASWARSEGIASLYAGTGVNHLPDIDAYSDLGYFPLAARLEVARILVE